MKTFDIKQKQLTLTNLPAQTDELEFSGDNGDYICGVQVEDKNKEEGLRMIKRSLILNELYGLKTKEEMEKFCSVGNEGEKSEANLDTALNMPEMANNDPPAIRITAGDRNEDGTFKPGVSGNPSGRPKGTMKDYLRRKFMELSDENKEQFLIDNKVTGLDQIKLAEGNPEQKNESDVKVSGMLDVGALFDKSKLNE